MEEVQRMVVISHLADALRQEGSWCGETHLQKSTYLLQTIFSVPTDFRFVLYKHGPFSFELRDVLNVMLSSGLLELEHRPGYRPSMVRTAPAERLEAGFHKTVSSVDRAVQYVARLIGSAGVFELERTATAVYLLSQRESDSNQHLAEELNRLKPHVSIDDALVSISDMRGRLEEARR
jgi:hypothetical protein